MDDASLQRTITFIRTPAEQDREFRDAMKRAQNRISGGKSNLLRPIVSVAVSVLGIGAFIVIFKVLNVPIPLDLIGVPGALCVMIVLIPWILTRRGFRKIMGSAQNIEYRLSLGDEGVTVATDKNTHLYAWRSISKIKREREDLQIVRGDWNEFSIPLRAFAPGQAASFEATMREMLEAHRDDAAPIACPPEQNPAYRISWQMEAEDYMTLSHQLPAYKVLKGAGFLMLAGVIYEIAAINGPMFFGQGWPWQGASVSSMIPLGFIVFMIVSLFRKPKLSMSGKHSHLLREPVTVALMDAGVVQFRYGVETTIPWARVSSVDDRKGVVIFRSGKGPVTFIPARAFLDSDHRRAFLAAAEAYRAGKPAPEYTVWPPSPQVSS